MPVKFLPGRGKPRSAKAASRLLGGNYPAAGGVLLALAARPTFRVTAA